MTAPTPDDRFDEQAKQLMQSCNMSAMGWTILQERIASALRSMLPPKGHFMDYVGNVVGPFDSYQLISEAVHARGVLDCTDFDKGPVVRRVLGTLPVTADGCLYGQGAELWYKLPCGSATEIVSMTHSPYMEAHQPAYSTCAAAEAASAAPLVEELRKGEGVDDGE